MIFYHTTSKKEINSVIPFVSSRFSSKKYACLSTSLKQAEFWATMIARSRCFDEETGAWEKGEFYIYSIEVPDNELVENCPGHYHFEKPGQFMKAIDVTEHIDCDGEVNIYKEVPIIALIKKVTTGDFGKIMQKGVNV